MKNKHYDDQEVMEAEQHEVKRLKFNKDEEEEQEVDTLSSCHADSLSEETESMAQEKEKEDDEEDSEAASTARTCEDQGRPEFSPLLPSCRYTSLVKSFVDIS